MLEKLDYPKQLMQVNRSEEGMDVHWMKLKSTNQNPDEYDSFRWETMGKRRFYKAPETVVKPSSLKLYRLSKKN